MLHLAEGYQKSRCLGYDKQWWGEKGKEKNKNYQGRAKRRCGGKVVIHIQNLIVHANIPETGPLIVEMKTLHRNRGISIGREISWGYF